MASKRVAKKRAPSARGGSMKSSRAARSRIEVVRESRPRRKASRDEVLDDQHTGVAYSAGRANPYMTRFNGALNNPDLVLQQNGALDESFYDGVLLRHPPVAGILDQKVDRANRERVIVAGDPSDSRSVEIAAEARRHWNKIKDKTIVFGRFLRNKDFIGYGGVEKVFTRDAHSGLVYPYRLIDRKCENIKFRDDGTALWCPYGAGGVLSGEPIPRRKMILGRSGSINDPYGDGLGRYIYPATYLIEKTVEMMLDGVEEFGRPIPIVKMPRAADALTKPEREKVRAFAKRVHSRYIEVPTDDIEVGIDTGNAAMATTGQIGRPELAIIEMLITWIYVRMIRVVQTLNKTGGSRALEDVRYDITDDASRPLSFSLDSDLNAQAAEGDEYTGWMADFCDFNFPEEPDEILPRFDTPALSHEAIAAIHSRAMDLIDRGVEDISQDWYLRSVGVEKAKDAADRLGGKPANKPTVPVAQQGGAVRSLADVAAQANILSRELDQLLRLGEAA